MNTIERAPRQARPRRRAMRIVGAVCVVALVATAAYVAWSRENARPQPYGGAATANDQLIRVVTDPSGDAWAIGIHYDRPLAENGVQAVSTFIIHDAQGRWSMSKSLDITTGEYIDNLAMVSADEGWAIGGVNGNNRLILHYQHGAWSEESYHPLGEFLGIAMVSPTEGWVVGCWSGENPQTGQSNVMTLLHYHDGTWTRVPSPAAGPFQAVAMSSAVAGWAAGATGPTPQPPLLRYADGVWAPAPIASASLSTTASPPDVIGALAAPSASVAWAVGANGLMLRYRNGAWARVGARGEPDDRLTHRHLYDQRHRRLGRRRPL